MATHVAATRQPFAPLNSSRLQNLTSLKNRQNAITTLTSPSKRKAESYDFDTSNNDTENIDPVIFLSPKRSKASDGSSKETFTKPINFFLTKAPPSPNTFSSLSNTTSPRRPILEARSPIKKLNTKTHSTPLSAPAGRSPTRKRIGILNRRKTSSPFTRIDPPKFSTPSGLGFSIDAALSGTIPSYQRPSLALSKEAEPVPHAERKTSWFFEIHEDTAEEEATNMMEHSTCTLDISSDEESAARLRDERGKENVPPPDDVSQTRTQLGSFESETNEAPIHDIKARIKASRKRHENAIEIDRAPLGDLEARDFYAEGCDGSSVFLIGLDDVDHQAQEREQELGGVDAVGIMQEQAQPILELTPEDKGKGKEIDIDALMRRDVYEIAPKAAVLEPIEKAEEGFEVWESGSAKGDE